MILDIRFDFDRQNRLGLIEAIWGEHKSIEQLKKIAQEVLKKGEFVFITRINESKARCLQDIYANAIFIKDADCLVIGENSNKIESEKTVAIVSGGSSDLKVTLEVKTALTLSFILSVIFDCINPGEIQLIVIFFFAYSIARDLVIPITPAFEAE